MDGAYLTVRKISFQNITDMTKWPIVKAANFHLLFLIFYYDHFAWQESHRFQVFVTWHPTVKFVTLPTFHIGIYLVIAVFVMSKSVYIMITQSSTHNAEVLRGYEQPGPYLRLRIFPALLAFTCTLVFFFS